MVDCNVYYTNNHTNTDSEDWANSDLCPKGPQRKQVTHSDSSDLWLPPKPAVQPPEQHSWGADSVCKQIKRRQCWALFVTRNMNTAVWDQSKRRQQELSLAPYLIRVGCVKGLLGLWSSDKRLTDRQWLRRQDGFEWPRSSTWGNWKQKAGWA